MTLRVVTHNTICGGLTAPRLPVRPASHLTTR